MAVKFTEIEYKNFKSVGNSPIKIKFDVSKTTLITGKNGSGKSTLISAVCFALFGQDFTLNKPGLINSINQKQLEVTIWFEIGKKKYKIVRGIKPNIFRIYEDDKLLNEDSSTRDYQKILETQILKFDIRAFKQVVVIGGSSYVPFMKLRPYDRREFIEDLLDIRVFSTMGNILKEKVKALKEEIRIIDEELRTIKEKVKLQESFVKKLEQEKSVSVSKIEDEIRKIEEESVVLDSEYETIEQEIGVFRSNIDALGKVEDELIKIETGHHTTVKTRDKHEKAVSFYSVTEVCPTCTQNIAPVHRDHIIKSTSGEIEECNRLIDSYKDRMSKLKELISKKRVMEVNIDDLHKKGQLILNKKRANSTLIEKAKTQITTIKSDTDSINTEKVKLKEFAQRYVELSAAKKKLFEDSQYQDFVGSILTDGGIKTKIIKQYIPTINKLINKYLTALDFFVSFNLDEEFNESIKSRHRDTFKYDNFSDGQKARIDLSLMFAWRDIAKMRNAVNTNLLYLDEADAAVDGDGSSLLSDLLHTVEKSNVFIISHKGDILRDKFERVLTFDIENNFTVLSEV